MLPYWEVKADLQINDLLGSSQFDTKKHEIKLDRDGKMSVTDVVSSMSFLCFRDQ
jgi:hypothetical protein